MATVLPETGSVVGVTGGGYISVLAAKLAANAGYKTWILCQPEDRPNIEPLIGQLPNQQHQSLLELVDSNEMDERLPSTDAVIIAIDANIVMGDGGLDYIFERAGSNLKRIVAMSRNLNGEGMGFFATASRKAANTEVWDNAEAADYQQFDDSIRNKAKAANVEYTIARAGTLKGGACGEETDEDGNKQGFPQFLTKKFYEMTKKDIVTWQLLFDCRVRGVRLARGDVMPGPGFKAVLTATGTDQHDGDTGRCGLAEAMVQSLSYEQAANTDFGVATKEGREPPTQEEWDAMFRSL